MAADPHAADPVAASGTTDPASPTRWESLVEPDAGAQTPSAPAATGPTPRGSYPLITGLYVTQYVGIGFLASALIVILRGNGTPLDQLGLLTLVGIIWPIKFLWAPILDRWGSTRLGHYRGWLLLLQPLMILTVLAMLPFGSLDDLAPIILLAVLLAFLSATQDTASDALAIRAMHGKARGVANGIQVMGGYLGNLLGGGVTLIIYGQFGWTAAILFLAAVTAIPLITLAAYREPPREATREQPTLGEAFRALGNVLKQPGARTWALAVSPLSLCGITLLSSLLSPALVDAGWNETQIGTLNGVILGAAGIGGGLAGGFLIRWIGRERTLAITGAVLLVATVPFILVAFSGAAFAATAAVLVAVMFAYTALSTVMLTVSMDYARPGTAGTDYTLIVSIAQLASFLAAAACLAAAETFGYTSVAWVSVLLTGAAVVLGLRHLRVHREFLASRA